MGIFSDAEMTRRMDALRAGLAERGLDGALLSSADNTYYMTGVPLLSEWGRPMWGVVRADGGSAIVGAAIEKENMERNSATDEVFPYDDGENVVGASLELAADFLSAGKGGVARVGIERAIIPLGLYESLGERLANIEFVEIGDLVEGLRIVKSDEEMRLLDLGGAIAKLGAHAFLDTIAENVTELTVAAHAVAEMNRGLGALMPEGLTSTYAYCQFAEHAHTPHLHPTGKRLRRGDIVGLNVFPVIWGYCMELERTFVFGEPTAAQGEALEAVNRAQDAGMAAIRPGAKLSDIDHMTRKMLSEAGYGALIRHGTGHAHGIMIGAAGREERGEIRTYNDRVLEPGMVNSVEPGIYGDIGAFRHSDVMACTADGGRWMTEFPRDIAYG